MVWVNAVSTIVVHTLYISSLCCHRRRGGKRESRERKSLVVTFWSWANEVAFVILFSGHAINNERCAQWTYFSQYDWSVCAPLVSLDLSVQPGSRGASHSYRISSRSTNSQDLFRTSCVQTRWKTNTLASVLWTGLSRLGYYYVVGWASSAAKHTSLHLTIDDRGIALIQSESWVNRSVLWDRKADWKSKSDLHTEPRSPLAGNDPKRSSLLFYSPAGLLSFKYCITTHILTKTR